MKKVMTIRPTHLDAETRHVMTLPPLRDGAPAEISRRVVHLTPTPEA